MLGLVFALTTVLFGSFLRSMIYPRGWGIAFSLSVDWLLGAMCSGLVLFVSGFLFPLDSKHVTCLMGLQVVVALYHNVQRPNPVQSKSKLLIVIAVAAVGLFHLFNVYRDCPTNIASDIREFYDFESSFVASVLDGCNYRRNKIFEFNDPLHDGYSLCIPAIPSLYTAALVAVGMSFQRASILVKGMNILSTACAAVTLSQSLIEVSIVPMLLYIFNRGIAEGSSVISLLTGSIHGSFTIPLTMFSMVMACSAGPPMLRKLAGVLLALNPSPAASLALVVCTTNFAHSVKEIGFSISYLSLIPKLLTTKISYAPFWREDQMNGVFYSQILVWFEYIGAAFVGVFVFWMSDNGVFVHRFLSAVSGWIVLCFVRFGNDRVENLIGVTAVFVPFLIMSIYQAVNRLVRNNNTAKGAVCVLAVICVLYGASNIFRQQNGGIGLSKHDFDIAEAIRTEVPVTESIFSLEMAHNPAAVLAGRAVFAYNISSLWNRGADVKTEVEAFRAINDTESIYEHMIHTGYKVLLAKEPVNTANFTVVYTNEEYVLMKMK